LTANLVAVCATLRRSICCCVLRSVWRTAVATAGLTLTSVLIEWRAGRAGQRHAFLAAAEARQDNAADQQHHTPNVMQHGSFSIALRPSNVVGSASDVRPTGVREVGMQPQRRVEPSHTMKDIYSAHASVWPKAEIASSRLSGSQRTRSKTKRSEEIRTRAACQYTRISCFPRTVATPTVARALGLVNSTSSSKVASTCSISRLFQASIQSAAYWRAPSRVITAAASSSARELVRGRPSAVSSSSLAQLATALRHLALAAFVRLTLWSGIDVAAETSRRRRVTPKRRS